jgi:CHAT domain-containing protein/tetratricopeptide (TPR) repeat protein
MEAVLNDGIRFASASLMVCLLLICRDQRGAFAASPTLESSSPAAAELIVSEVDQSLKVASVGQILYSADAMKSTGLRYCAMSNELANQGEFRKAVQSASKALFLGLRDRDPMLSARAARDLAYSYNLAGWPERADYWAHEAIKYVKDARGRDADPKAIYGPTFKTLGDIQLQRWRPDLAIPQYERALEQGDWNFRPLVQAALARAYAETGDMSQASKVLADAKQNLAPTLRAYLSRTEGEIALLQHNYSAALQVFDSASTSASGDDADYIRMWAAYGTARAHKLQGDAKLALASLQKALDLAETVRSRFRSEEFKTGVFGKIQTIFDEAITLALDMGADEEALGYAERARARAMLDLISGRVQQQSTGGQFGATVRASAVSEIRATIPAETAVVVYHLTSDRDVAWVVRRESVTVIRLPGDSEEVGQKVRALRVSIQQHENIQAASAVLYDELVKPLHLKAKESVIFVPHKTLHLLPFQALQGPNGYLIQERSISYLPSASALVAIGASRKSTNEEVLAMGNPDLGRKDMDLPGAVREVQSLSVTLPGVKSYLRADATPDVLIAEGPKSRIIHIAAHAMVDELDPLRSTIYLSPGKTRRGEIEALDLYEVDLAGTRLVVLSACESGLGVVAQGDEFFGFQRTFLAAGAGALVGSLWSIADDPTARLMASFYNGVKSGQTLASALRQAELTLLQDPVLSHPLFWAPFNLVGDAR